MALLSKAYGLIVLRGTYAFEILTYVCRQIAHVRGTYFVLSYVSAFSTHATRNTTRGASPQGKDAAWDSRPAPSYPSSHIGVGTLQVRVRMSVVCRLVTVASEVCIMYDGKKEAGFLHTGRQAGGR